MPKFPSPCSRVTYSINRLLKAVLLTLCVPAMAGPVGSPKPGVWGGSIGEYPIILCVEDGKAAYYYPGQSADIALDVKEGVWLEKVGGGTTGQWTVNAQGKGDEDTNSIGGVWRKPGGKAGQPFDLRHLASLPSACSSAMYQQALLVPNEVRLTLPLPKPGQIDAERKAAAVVMANGELWTWDENHPQPKLAGKGYVRVAVGSRHTIAIKADGSLWGWGSNERGQLGGEDVEGDQPVHMGRGFVAIAANDAYSLAVRNDGTLWSWGGAEQSMKGGLIETRKSKPRLIGKSFVSVSAGDKAFAAIKNDGTLWMWGSGGAGQLGLGSGGSSLYRRYGYELFPALVGKEFKVASTGYAHSAAVRKDGSLWTWGHASWGTLGNGSDKGESHMPANIGAGYSQAVAGFLNSAAIKNDGSLWLWGGNERGIFGDCTTANHNRPVQLGTGFIQADLGADFLVAMKSDGTVWTWGYPWAGDQMDVQRACRKPAKVSFGDGVGAWEKPVTRTAVSARPEPPVSGIIADIAAGQSHSAMVKRDGSLWTWGSNEFGQLGSQGSSRNLPQQSGEQFTEVTADAHHTFGLKRDGSLMRWGDDRPPSHRSPKEPATALGTAKVFPDTRRLLSSGYQFQRALGLRKDGAILDWHNPEAPAELVVFGSDVVDIAAGHFGSFAVRKDGTLWKLEQYPVKPPPTQIGKDFAQVVSGAGHAYGIKGDGSLWAWGDNRLYQLGDGTRTTRTDPARIGSGFVQVATGRFHGIALASDGSVWTWGDNETGVIGDGTTAARAKPVKVGTGFTKVAAGDYHSLAIKQDGTVWAWGNNEDGQLGDGTNFRRLAPVQVYPILAQRTPAAAPAVNLRIPVTTVHTGRHRSCASFRDGSMKCWGNGDPKPRREESKEETLRQLATYSSSSFDCLTAVKECKRIGGKFPLLRGARTIAGDETAWCAHMKNGSVRCSSEEGGFVVDGIHDAVQVHYVYGHGCALQADGRVKCWGQNTEGELGNGTIGTNYADYHPVALEVVGL